MKSACVGVLSIIILNVS